MSYAIMGGTRNSHMLTFQTTRRTKCMYFDGESAALGGTGQLDTQMLHIWGNLTGPREPMFFLEAEYARAAGLCDWIRREHLGGPGWGYEGIVRMNAGFEMIWCDFSSPSLRLVSLLNISAPLLPPPLEEAVNINIWEGHDGQPSPLPLPTASTRSGKSAAPTGTPQDWKSAMDMFRREPFIRSMWWVWYKSSTLHYGSSADGPGRGETRVKLDTCGFLSYYSPLFASKAAARAEDEQKSLNLTKEGYWIDHYTAGNRYQALTALTRRRRLHTLKNVTITEAALMRHNSERVLREFLAGSSDNCTGLDWHGLSNEIVQTYARPLSTFLGALKGFGNATASNQTTLRTWMADIRDQSHNFVLPFLEYPKPDAARYVYKRDSELFNKTYTLCRFQHTRLFQSDEDTTLGPEELLKWAVEETMGGICSVIIDIGLAVEEVWRVKFNRPLNATSKQLLSRHIDDEVQRWTHGIEELMAWLGWAGEWVGCGNKCASDESCYIPMWPIFRFSNRRGGPPQHSPYYGYPGYSESSANLNVLSNRTYGPSKGGLWDMDETDLWEPKCIKQEDI